MNKRKLKIGWAQTSITPDRNVLMEGQMYQRVSRYVHDPITATVLALDNGDAKAVFVSLDMTMPPMHAMNVVLERMKNHPEIPVDCISYNVTHTHNATSFYDDCMRTDNEKVYDPAILPASRIPEDTILGDEATEFFADTIYDLILTAWEKRAPGGISYAHDYAAVGFSRRPMFARDNGTETIMYGDCSEPDFMGFEEDADTSVELLYTWNESAELTGIVCNVPCPSQVYELHCFISADYWAPTRSAIREKLGRNVYILPVCGAAGDLAPVDLVHISKTNKQALLDWGGQTKEVFRDFDMTLLCQSIADRISEAVVRGYRTAKNYIDYKPAFVHEFFDMSLPIRQVSEEDYEKACEEVRKIHETFSAEHRMEMSDVVRAFEPQGVILRYRQQIENPNYFFRCHILRLGNIAICTNPFELYVAYAHIIKARAVAEQVFVIQLSNGLGGYLPTQRAVNGGSYSSKPASTTCGPDGGKVLVEKTLSALNMLWKK